MTAEQYRRVSTVATWALVALIVAAVAIGWWWSSTADDRALHQLREERYNQCLYEAAVADSSAEADAILARCDQIEP